MRAFLIAILILLTPAAVLAMPQVIPIVVYAVFSSIEGFAVYAAAAAAVASVAVAAYSANEQRRAARQAAQAFANSAQDRLVTVRSSVASRKIVVGQCAVGGVLTYFCKYNGWTIMVIALSWKEVEEIGDVIVDGTTVTPGMIASNGYVNSGSARFAPAVDVSHTQTVYYRPGTGGLNAGNSYSVTLAHPLSGNLMVTAGPVNVAETGNFYNSWEVHGVLHAPTNETEFQIGTDGQTLIFWGAPPDPPLAGQENAVTINYTEVTHPAYLRIRKHLGGPDQVADAELITESGGEWTTEHRGRGQPYIVVAMNPDANVFPNGPPNISAVIKGAKFQDPRTGVVAWTQNQVSIARGYLLADWGVGAQVSEIDAADAIAGANVCDENVEYQRGVTHRRYQCNGVIDTEGRLLDNLKALLSSANGAAPYAGGVFRLLPGFYRSPTMTLTAEDLRGKISIQTNTPRASIVNQVRGTFVDSANAWQPTDVKPATSTTYVTEDGELLPTDIELPFETDANRAHRVLRQYLLRARLQMKITGEWTFKALNLRAGDTVNLQLPELWSGDKVFVVGEWTLPADLSGVDLVLVEESSNAYAWEVSDALDFDPAPNTNFPTAVPTTPTGVAIASGPAHALVTSDGTQLVRMFVTWTPVVDARVNAVQVQYRQVTEPDPTEGGMVAGSAGGTYINAARDGTAYLVRLRAIAGQQSSPWSPWIYHFATGTTVPLIGSDQLEPGAAQGYWGLTVTTATSVNGGTGPNSAADTINVTTIGSPVRIEISYQCSINVPVGNTSWGKISLFCTRDGSNVAPVSVPILSNFVPGTDGQVGGTFTFNDTPPAGAHTYVLTFGIEGIRTGSTVGLTGVIGARTHAIFEIRR